MTIEEEIAKPKIKAEFDPKKAEDYFNALVHIAERRLRENWDYGPDNCVEVWTARRALGLPEDIPEIDNADF